MRGARPDLFLGLILLRQLPLGPLAGQFAPGAARLLRRAHLRAHRPAARKILPHRLAGADASAARDVRRARALSLSAPASGPINSIGSIVAVAPTPLIFLSA